MSNAHNPQHWSQLDTEEQIGISGRGREDGHVASFWFPRRRNLPVAGAARALHKTQNVKTPSWFRPGITKNWVASWGTPITVFELNRTTGEVRLRIAPPAIRCTSETPSGWPPVWLPAGKSNVCWMLSGQC